MPRLRRRTPDPVNPPHCAWPSHPRSLRTNCVATAAVVALMIALAVPIGVGASLWLAAARDEARDAPSAIPPALSGAAIALAVASLATLWAYFCGSAAVLRMNDARPLAAADDPGLHATVAALARDAGVPTPRLFQIDDSALNCCSTGRNPATAAIVLTRGLRAALSPAEVRAVLAHEFAHIRTLDTRFALVMATMPGLIALLCDRLWRLAYQTARASKRSTDTVKAGGWIAVILFILAGVLSLAAPIISGLLQFFVRRDREYRADAEAAALTGDPASLASALRKCAADSDPLVDVANRATAHLFIVNPLRRMRESGQSLDSPFCSHPPVAKRIARLEELAASARTHRSQPA